MGGGSEARAQVARAHSGQIMNDRNHKKIMNLALKLGGA